jgi:hypothetical protein
LFLYDKIAAEKKYRKTLTDMVFQEYVRLVQSDDFDAGWEESVGRWYAAGGEAMSRQRNGR